MKRLLLIFTCCSPLVFFPVISFALDATIVTSQEIPFYKKYGPIRYYESLWSVSKKLRPNDSVSVQQTLLAIYKLNPDAFFAADINHLIENSVINVPTGTFIKKQSQQDAINLINKYSNNNKKATKPVVVVKSAKLPSLSEPEEAGDEQSLTASLIEKNYFPYPKEQLNSASVSPDPGDPQNNSTADNVKKALSQEAESQSSITIQALKTELDSVNEQLAATAKVNQEFKSRLQLLIDEIDLLRHKIEGESATQIRLLTLIEQSKPSQQPVADVNVPKESWIDGSLTDLLLVAGAALLLITFVFFLLFRRRTKILLDKKINRMNESGASFVTSESENNDVQKDIEPQNPGNIKLSSIKKRDSSPSEMPRHALGSDLINQDDHIGVLKVAESFALASLVMKSETSFDVQPDEVDKRPALKDDQLTAVNTADKNVRAAAQEQPFETASLDYPNQLQQSKQNCQDIHTPVEKESFTGTIHLKNTERYIDIDTLLKDSEGDSQDDLYTGFEFDFGLDGFPDMLNENTEIDIDDDEYAISARLDLARAYLEIDDKISAKKILMASITNSNVEERREIDKLLTRL